MKTTDNRNHAGILTVVAGIRVTTLVVVLATALLVSSCVASACSGGGEAGVSMVPPAWAPVYDHVNAVRYYYLPDIEAYYDVRSHEFVYLDNGNWIFSPTLPPQYAWYDLYGGFTVVLDYRVHQPWMHFHHYVANYPRFYYQSVYRVNQDHSDRPMMGFNENSRALVYRNTTPGSSTRVNNGSGPTRMDPSTSSTRSASSTPGNRPDASTRNQTRQMAAPANSGQNKSASVPRPAQRMNYYGRHIGHPVKVTKRMSNHHGGKHRG